MYPGLATVDWDFVGAKTGYLTHGFHPYPAKFIPQIPARLIAELSSPGEIVVDPFCGSGTALVEAVAAGRSALGADVNPVAVVISRAKTLPLNGDDERDARELADTVRACSEMFSGRLRLIPLSQPDVVVPADDAIDFWFDPSVARELGVINGAIRACKNSKVRLVAKVALSAIIVSVSKQDSDTRYVRRKKRLKAGGVAERFHAKMIRMVEVLRRLRNNESLKTEAWVGDARRLPLAAGSADLVVTSPPYPNAYSYHLYHRTRLLWLGFDPQRVKSMEIGSHRHYSARNGASRSTFKADMQACFEELRRVLRSRRYACFVIGDSTIRGEVVDNSRVLEEAACEVGFNLDDRFTRNIDVGRKSFNPVIGKIKQEHILLFRAP